MVRLLILLSTSMDASAVGSVPSAGELNPVGNYGTLKQWKPEWSEAFYECIQKPKAKALIQKIANGGVKDVGSGGKWCQNSDVYKPSNASTFLLNSFKRLAKYESSYNPGTINRKSPNPPAVGLFQIGPKDAKRWKCQGPKGNSVASEADLKDPGNNVCCAITIAAGVGKKQNVFGSGKQGVLASFWEPARVQKSKGAKGEKLAGEINQDCRNLGKTGGITTTAELQKAQQIFGSGGGSGSQTADLSLSGGAAR